MKLKQQLLTSVVTGLTMLGSSLMPISIVSAAEVKSSSLEIGKKLAFSREKGNCLACHMIVGGESPGHIAPPLIAMKARFPDKKVLKEQIWDASLKNSETIMPVFGRYEVLTNEEINHLVEYIHSL